MSKFNIIFISEKKKNLFKKFISKLQPQTQAKLIRTIDLLKKHGASLPLPYVKKIDSKLWELRSLGKESVRIIYSIIKQDILFLNWFIKKSNKIPLKKIKNAKNSLHKYIKNAILSL